MYKVKLRKDVTVPARFIDQVEERLNDGRPVTPDVSLTEALTWRDTVEGMGFWQLASMLVEKVYIDHPDVSEQAANIATGILDIYEEVCSLPETSKPVVGIYIRFRPQTEWPNGKIIFLDKEVHWDAKSVTPLSEQVASALRSK